MTSLSASTPAPTPTVLRSSPPRPPQPHRGTLRDLYTFGLVSVFRRESILRVWEPLRESPSRSRDDFAK